MPDLLQLAVDHHGIGIVLHSDLLGKGVLLTLPRDQEGDGFLDVIKGKFFELGGEVAGL